MVAEREHRLRRRVVERRAARILGHIAARAVHAPSREPGRLRRAPSPSGGYAIRGGTGSVPAGSDCAIRYGHSMAVNRVHELDPMHYREERVGRILPTWLPGAICTHTLNMTDRYVVTDGMRMAPRWATARDRHHTI